MAWHDTLTIPLGVHSLLVALIWLYAMVTVLGDLGWWNWAKDRTEDRGWWFNFSVFAVLILLVLSSGWVGWVTVGNNKSVSPAARAYASAFY